MTAPSSRDICVTGLGLLSPLGETPAQWLSALADPAVWRGRIDTASCAPFPVHVIGEYDLARQVPKPGDQRAMGPLMQYGTYAAGLALEDAGLKGDAERLAETHLVVAAGGGERDWDLDEQLLARIDEANDREAFLNRELSDGLRPTLFLAQLPNLFAGNISIVHGVSGSSRTFMGEESAGVDAVRIACRRIAGGQADRFLVGATFNAARPDLLFMYHAGNILLDDAGVPELWARPSAGLCFGDAGAFLVLEARETAEARGARVRAVVRAVESGRSDRRPAAAATVARQQIEALGDGLAAGTPVLSGASGAGPATAEEHDFLADLAGAGRIGAVRGMAAATGHSVEAAFVQNLVLGVAMLEAGSLCPPLNPSAAIETAAGPGPGLADRLLVTSWGHVRGEGLALVEKADG